MKLRANPEAFNPAPSSITVDISGGRKITILPCSPDFVPNIRNYLLQGMGFADSESATEAAVNEASLLALRVLFGYVLDDATLEIETPELQYPPTMQDLAFDAKVPYGLRVLAHARAINEELEGKAARRLISWQDITAVTEGAFGITLKAEAAKNA